MTAKSSCKWEKPQRLEKWMSIEMQYSELRIQILLNGATLEQCHNVTYMFHFMEFKHLKYVHVLIHILLVQIQNHNEILLWIIESLILRLYTYSRWGLFWKYFHSLKLMMLQLIMYQNTIKFFSHYGIKYYRYILQSCILSNYGEIFKGL